jgi:hypothetical protein
MARSHFSLLGCRTHSMGEQATDRALRQQVPTPPYAQSPRRECPFSTESTSRTQAFLIAIFFSLLCTSVAFGSVTVSTPFLKFASILSASTPSGTPNERWKEP